MAAFFILSSSGVIEARLIPKSCRGPSSISFNPVKFNAEKEWKKTPRERNEISSSISFGLLFERMNQSGELKNK